MNDVTLPLAVWLAVAYGDLRVRAKRAYDRLLEDDGLDDSVTRMLMLGAAVVLALAAITVAYAVFTSAKGEIDDNPVLPAPP